MRWVPLALLLAFALASMGRMLLHRRATGVNPYVLPDDDSPEGYIARALRWTISGLVVALLHEALDRGDRIGALPWAGERTAYWSGIVLAVAALLWVTVAQAQMGHAWRIGIDRQHATVLVRHGLFAISRNPIFLGMRVALLGAVLLVPNALMLAVAVAAEVLIQVQTRLEEVHLLTLHGDNYNTYARTVRRWLGCQIGSS